LHFSNSNSNSFQLITIVFLLYYLHLYFFLTENLLIFIISWLVISLIFVGYIFFSPIKSENKLECIFKYIISPIFWITIFCYIRNNYSLDYIIKLLIIFISNVSVLIFYNDVIRYVSFVKYFIIAPI
jgi:hypothetical protein